MSASIQGAEQAFQSGFNCAESVLIGVSQALRMNESVVPRAATGFGGGMGGCGGPCGALTGAVIAVGLKYGRTTPAEDRRRSYAIVQRIYEGFEKEMGQVNCRDLTGFDLRTPEGYQQFRASGVSERVCRKAVAVAQRLALEQLGPHSPSG